MAPDDDTMTLLNTIALVRAYVVQDREGFQALAEGTNAETIAALLSFVHMLLQYHNDGDAVGYLDSMANSLAKLMYAQAE